MLIINKYACEINTGNCLEKNRLKIGLTIRLLLLLLTNQINRLEPVGKV